MNRKSKVQPIGWRGMEIRIPKELSFTSETSRPRMGYMSFTSALSKFDVKWEKVRGSVQIERYAERFIGKMQKSYRELKFLETGQVKVFGHKALWFHFKSELEGYAVVWYCDIDKKVSVGLYVCTSERIDEASQTFKQIINSIRCHTTGGWHRWSFFSFSLELPEGFDVRDKSILVGYGSLELSRLESHPSYSLKEEADLEYWGIADVNFRDMYNDLEKWFKKNQEKAFKKRHKGVNMGNFQNFTVNGHEAKTFKSTGKSKRITQVAIESNTYLWYCPHMNRIYLLTLTMGLSRAWLSKTKNEEALKETFNRILASVSCH